MVFVPPPIFCNVPFAVSNCNTKPSAVGDHVLDDTMLVIADGKKACALAGVMGGANSEITEGTKTVVFESACFNGASVRVTAKKNGMRTVSIPFRSTAENLAKLFFDELKARIPGLVAVKVWETADSCAEYRVR